MSEYREFTGKTVEEALKLAREAFGADLNDLDFEILTPGSRGVLGMGAEPARIVAAPVPPLVAPPRSASRRRTVPRHRHRHRHTTTVREDRPNGDRPPRPTIRPRPWPSSRTARATTAPATTAARGWCAARGGAPRATTVRTAIDTPPR